MSFDYEQSIWGRGVATLAWSDPASYRLHQALAMLDMVAVTNTTIRVLEIGSGAGQFIRAIKALRGTFECYGADISHEAIALAQKANDGVRYSLSHDTALPYADSFFDCVLIFDVLEHVESPASILTEAKRVLKPGGCMYSFVPCEGDVTSLWHWLDVVHLKNDLTKKYAGHINYFTRQELKMLYVSSGFTLKSMRYSEHIVGQILGVLSFILMHSTATKKGLSQINNEAYFSGRDSKALTLLKKIINTIVYAESAVLSAVPSPNAHLVVTKNN